MSAARNGLDRGRAGEHDIAAAIARAQAAAANTHDPWDLLREDAVTIDLT